MASLCLLVRSRVFLGLVAAASVACQTTPGTDPVGGSSSGGPTTETGEGTTTSLSSSESSTGGASVDGTGTTGTGTTETDTDTDTDGPAPEPVCETDACWTACTHELQTQDPKGNACSCTTSTAPPDWVSCELPTQCGGLNDYPCILQGVRDGVVGNYIWSYVIGDVGGETVLIQVVEPGRARAIESSFEELACCDVQSRDTSRYHGAFDLVAPDDPFWEACLALAPEVEGSINAIPDCLRPEMLRVGACMADDGFACPPSE